MYLYVVRPIRRSNLIANLTMEVATVVKSASCRLAICHRTMFKRVHNNGVESR